VQRIQRLQVRRISVKWYSTRLYFIEHRHSAPNREQKKHKTE